MLKISNVYKTFNKGTINEKRALNGIDLVLKDGDFVTVIGGNGAGKSTMLNMIAGVYPIDAGKITIDDMLFTKDGEENKIEVNISRMPEHSRAKYLGRVFQDPMKGTAAGMEIQHLQSQFFATSELVKKRITGNLQFLGIGMSQINQITVVRQYIIGSISILLTVRFELIYRLGLKWSRFPTRRVTSEQRKTTRIYIIGINGSIVNPAFHAHMSTDILRHRSMLNLLYCNNRHSPTATMPILLFLNYFYIIQR